MDFTKMAWEIIHNNHFLSLATTNKKGDVWITPLSYSVDNEYNFYITTAIDSLHIDNLKENPYVAFSIFDSTRRVSDIDGLQVKAIMGEVERSQLPEIVKNYYTQVFPDPKERAEWEADWQHFTQDEFPIYRFFQIAPIEIFKRDTSTDEVDRRVLITIDDLKRIRE